LLTAIVALTFVACVPQSSRKPPSRTTSPSRPSSSLSASRAAPAPAATSTSTASRQAICGNDRPHPQRYAAIVVFSFENRTWSDVGGLGFASMPFLHALAAECAYFADWTQTDTKQDSLTQYVGQVTGAPQASTVNDCSPSATCSTQADNIFRQAERAGLVAIDYVEGTSTGCSAAGNAAKHIPALYLWRSDDRARCNDWVRPLSDLNIGHLPNFALITPTLCNDGHDCSNQTVDAWARVHITAVTDSAEYRSGKVAVFVWYDEYQPVPNLWITPTAEPGVHVLAGAGYAGTLAAWESMLGLPCLANACAAPDMRAAAGS
jgi:hypothetical protein